MRALTKVLTGVVLVAVSTLTTQAASADIEYYEVTTFIIGSGDTPIEANNDAVDQYTEFLINLAASLPPNEWIAETHIQSGFLAPTVYYLDVTVIIARDNGPQGPGGGPGGGGSAGAG